MKESLSHLNIEIEHVLESRDDLGLRVGDDEIDLALELDEQGPNEVTLAVRDGLVERGPELLVACLDHSAALREQLSRLEVPEHCRQVQWRVAVYVPDAQIVRELIRRAVFVPLYVAANRLKVVVEHVVVQL